MLKVTTCSLVNSTISRSIISDPKEEGQGGVVTKLEMLVVAHLVADWLLQTGYMANYKMQRKFFNLPLASHVAMYTLCTGMVLAHTNMSLWWLVLISGSHYVLDRRWPVKWWIVNIMRTDEKLLDGPLWWLVIAVDQVMHIVILAFVAGVEGGVI